ncbi:MAG: hypothetical protein ACI8VL_000108, partial [Bacteroidia bacterium]
REAVFVDDLTRFNNCLTNFDTRIDLCYFSRAFCGAYLKS